jgi:hypothetical protein
MEIGRSDVAFALLKTEELDWMVENILPEYKEQKRLLDPSQFHVGFFRPVKVLEASSSNEYDTELLVSNPEEPNTLDIWVKRDYDTQRDRVLLTATLTFRFAGLELGSVSGRTINLPDGTHAVRCIIPTGGRVEIAFDASGNVRLDLAVPSSLLFSTLLCVPFYSEYESEEENDESGSEDDDEDGGDDSDGDEEEEEFESDGEDDEEQDSNGNTSDASGAS